MTIPRVPETAGRFPRARASVWGRLGRLILKELREILRDRRTIITLVLMPLLLYPLLSIAFQQFLLAYGTTDRKLEYLIGFSSEKEFHWFNKYVFSRHPSSRPAARAADAARNKAKPPPVVRGESYPDVEAAVRNGKVDVGIRLLSPRLADLDDVSPDRDLAIDCELLYVTGSGHGKEVLDWVAARVASANEGFLRARLKRFGVSQRPVPVRAALAPLPPREVKGSISLAALVPLILILMTITGAVYPAIDLTAGERERGTLEVLVAAPIPRLGLLFAKYVTVLTVAVLTALANLVMMSVTLLATGLGSQLFGGGLSPLVIVEVFALLLLFAAFFSAVLLVLTSFARSFKEAQAYLVPLMLVSLAPGLAGMLPGLSLSGWLAAAPLINVVLLGRDLLEHHVNLAAAVVVVLSTLLYALAALSLAARIFGAEAVLYSEQGGWADLFRRPTEPRPAASASAALFCVALMFPTGFVLNGVLARWQGTAPALWLALHLLATLLLFGVLPLIFATRGHVRVASGFRLLRAPWPAFIGAVLLGLTLWPFALEVLLALSNAGVTGLSPEHQEKMREVLAKWRALPPAWVLLAYAVLPAVFEELFFRGYLFSALRGQLRPAAAIVVSAVLFGLFHLSFAFSQAISATLLGLVLGWLCWRTGSVFPGMVLHACHNAFLVLVSYYHKEISRLGWFDNPDSNHLPVMWLLGAAVGAGLGAALVWLGRELQRRNQESGSRDQERQAPTTFFPDP